MARAYPTRAQQEFKTSLAARGPEAVTSVFPRFSCSKFLCPPSQDYMDAERAKGRNFDDIYSEVRVSGLGFRV